LACIATVEIQEFIAYSQLRQQDMITMGQFLVSVDEENLHPYLIHLARVEVTKKRFLDASFILEMGAHL
jgi:hypothetical protein